MESEEEVLSAQISFYSVMNLDRDRMDTFAIVSFSFLCSVLSFFESNV